MMFKNKNLQTFEVLVQYDGHHPYISKEEQINRGLNYDYPTIVVTLTIIAKDWNSAAKMALFAKTGIKFYRMWVISISKASSYENRWLRS